MLAPKLADASPPARAAAQSSTTTREEARRREYRTKNSIEESPYREKGG